LTVYRSVPLAAPRIDTPAAPDPKLAEKLFSYGLKAYYGKSFGDAEDELMNAVRNNNQDARYYYFLGLARLQQGKIEAAQDDFRQAAALERQGLPDSQTLNGYFERIQGPERQLINRYRP
jgi:tetratricopeptide (TPR) repeat protein